MSFAETTGNTRTQACHLCHLDVTHEELDFFGRDGRKLFWRPVPHTAPCGAPCIAGGVSGIDDSEVHIPLFGPCPKCGAVSSEIAAIADIPVPNHRLVIRRFLREGDLEIEIEENAGAEWKRMYRWPAEARNVDDAIRESQRYVSWLQDRKRGRENIANLNRASQRLEHVSLAFLRRWPGVAALGVST